MSKKKPFEISSNTAVERLTALWALNESGLGGIMHAAKIPLSGILIAGFAVTLIALIGYFAENKFRSILKATTIVLLVKFIISPHSPLQAYFAVAFQGLLGAVIFSNISFFKAGTIFLAIAGLLESATQKLLILTLLYGTSFWKAVNLFYNYIANELSIKVPALSGSEVIISIYLGIHLIAGIAIGWAASNFPEHVVANTVANSALEKFCKQDGAENLNITLLPAKKKRRKFTKYLAVLVLIAFSTIPFAIESNGFINAVYLFLRVAAIITVWYFFVAPLLMKLLGKILKGKSEVYYNEVNDIIKTLPFLLKAAKILWDESKDKKGVKRINRFAISLVSFVLLFTPDDLRTHELSTDIIAAKK